MTLTGWHRGKSTGAKWGEELARVVASLEQLNRSTEADFLTIVGQLTGFVSVARSILADTRAIADSIVGETGDGVCCALKATLEETRRMQGRAAAALQLTGIRDSLAAIRRSFSGLERVGPSFHLMASLAQIETAHIGSSGADLGHLAGEFRSAGEEIRARVGAILQEAAALEDRIEAAFQDAAEFDERSLQDLPALLETAQEGLQECRSRQGQSAVSAQALTRESGQLAKAMDDLVASLQFHDITRQQVEHVMEALNHLRALSLRRGMRRPPAEVSQALELQLAQLTHSEAAFADAVKRMDRDLGAIADRIDRMVAVSGQLVGSDGGGQDSFYARMETCLQAISGAAGNCRTLEERTAGAIADLTGSLESLEASVGEIHAVEVALRRLALNASISAAHIGVKGEPLEAVAAAMSGLLTQCEIFSGEAGKSIRSLLETVSFARQNTAGPAEMETSTLDGLSAETKELQQSGKRTAARAHEMAALASRLSSDVEALRSGITAGQVFTAAARQCSEALREIQKQAGKRSARASAGEWAQFEQRYTMNAERDVHRAVLGRSEEVSEPPALPAEPGGPAEFGENVELF